MAKKLVALWQLVTTVVCQLWLDGVPGLPPVGQGPSIYSYGNEDRLRVFEEPTTTVQPATYTTSMEFTTTKMSQKSENDETVMGNIFDNLDEYIKNVEEEIQQLGKIRRLSGITGMLEFFASDQTAPADSSSRINYGCNCYGSSSLFPGSDSGADFKPLDAYDETCFAWKQCYERVKMNFPDCLSDTTSYKFTTVGDYNALLDEKSITCDDDLCSCARWYCECDQRFARESTKSFDSGNFDEFNTAVAYLRRAVAARSTNWQMTSEPSICAPVQERQDYEPIPGDTCWKDPPVQISDECDPAEAVDILFGNQPDVFAEDYRDSIKNAVTSGKSGEELQTAKARRDLIIKSIWEVIEDDRSPKATAIAEWMVDNGLFKFELALVFMCSKVPGRRRRSTSVETIIDEILDMKVCPTFGDVFSESWPDYMNQAGKAGVELANEETLIATQAGALPSRFVLLKILLDFLWTVNLDNNESQVEFKHLQYVFETRAWVLNGDNDMGIELENVALSTKDWIAKTIDDYSGQTNADQSVVTDLRRWLELYGGNSDLLATYVLAVGLETDRTPCDQTVETSSDTILQELLLTDLTGTKEEFLVDIQQLYTAQSTTPPADGVLDGIFAQANVPLLPLPCPSNLCWEYNSETDECTLRQGINCINLACPHDKMELSFQSELFGLEDNAPSAFGTDVCSPAWDSASNLWKLSPSLGTCNMDIKRASATELEFHKVISIGTNEPEFNLLDFTTNQNANVIRNKIPDGTSIHFYCRYASDVLVQSGDFTVHSVSSSEEYRSTGTLDGGFTIAIYKSDQFDGEITSSDKIFVGTNLFVQVTWSVSTLVNKVGFVLDDCWIKQNANPSQINIVRSNCYSSTLGAKLIDDHLVFSNARFRFRTFIVGDSANLGLTEVLSCRIRVCVTSETCDIITEDKNCPTTPGYNYKVRGED